MRHLLQVLKLLKLKSTDLMGPDGPFPVAASRVAYVVWGFVGSSSGMSCNSPRLRLVDMSNSQRARQNGDLSIKEHSFFSTEEQEVQNNFCSAKSTNSGVLHLS